MCVILNATQIKVNPYLLSLPLLPCLPPACPPVSSSPLPPESSDTQHGRPTSCKDHYQVSPCLPVPHLHKSSGVSPLLLLPVGSAVGWASSRDSKEGSLQATARNKAVLPHWHCLLTSMAGCWSSHSTTMFCPRHTALMRPVCLVKLSQFMSTPLPTAAITPSKSPLEQSTSNSIQLAILVKLSIH